MANNDFDKTRNDYQQYDLVTVFKASESRVLRHLHVATMAVVTKVDGDTVQCMPFPIREGTTANNIYAYNIGKSEFKEGDKVLVIFTDRDFRKNYDSATTSERSIGTTNDAKLHSIDYGVVIPIAKQYEGSIEALREKVDNHISNSNNPHKVTKEQVNLGNVVNQGMDITPTKGSGKYVTSGGVYDSIESVKSDLNATNEVVNQFEANYATKDYVVGNFANKYDTNKAIESISTKASNNETEISSIKENYVTKASADETYSKATETNTKLSEIDTKISDTNTNLSKTDVKVSTIEKNINDINTSLGTKQDKLSFGNGLSNTNNLITVDFTKVQAKLSVGNGILFSNDTLSIDTSVIPTIEYLEAQGYAKATDVTKNAEAIAEIKKDYAKSSSIGNGKVVIKQNGTEKGSFTMNQGEATEINLTDTDTHVAVVNNLTSSSTTSALSAYQGNVLNGKIYDTNKAVAGKQDAFTVGEGLTYASGVLAVDTSKFVGYTDYTDKMTSIDEKIATNASSISTLNTGLSSLTTRVATNETNISLLNSKVSSNEKSIETINTDVSSLKTSTADNKKSIDTINKNVSSLDGRVDVNEKSISTINGNVSLLDTRVTANEKSISDINTSLSSLPKSLEDVTAKVNANTSSISSLDSRVTTNSEDIKTAKASITTLTNDVANRYTKSETDNLLEKNIPAFGNREPYGYWGGGKYRYCLVCKIKLLATYQNVDLRFEYGANGDPLNIVVIKVNVADSLTSNYSFNIWSYVNTSYNFYIKDMGNGEANVYCDITGEQGFVYITRIWGRMLGLHQVTMVMGDADSIPDGAVSPAPYLWATYAQTADKASSSDIASTFTYADGIGVNLTSETAVADAGSWMKAVFNKDANFDGHNYLKVIRAEYGNYKSDAGMFGYYDCGLAWSNADTGGLITADWANVQAKMSSYRGSGLSWTRYLVLSPDGSDISQQTVKSFTATEVNHGCKFNGDLQSTSLTYSPRITSYNEIETAVDNSPKTAKTTKTRNVWFGNVEKEVTAPMNPFIEYFFDHGYHFNNFSSSTSDPDNVHDIGLVVWNRLLYFCTFTYTGTKKEFIVRPVTLGTAISTESLDDTSQPVVFEDTSTQSAQIDTKSVNIDVSPTYDEIEAKGSLYEWFGDKKDRVYNVFLRVDGRPPIRMDFDEEKSDFITADGKSCLDYPDMKGVLYETY